MLSPGDIVKDCEVIAPLGSGGMATLYLARRRGVGGFSRLVTLKLVHQHLRDDAKINKLFLDEARICAHVAHPNVVNVEEVGTYGGSYFIAMEYVHGASLAALSARLTERRLRLRPKLCVWLAAQVAEALHAAHEARGERGDPLSIVHRDVSPQNVLIGHTGHVKLIDFGVANSQSDAEPRSGGLPVLGKLRYMSPEQLRLEPIDRRTDVYALGVMLWEMLAGRSLLRCHRIDDERDWALRENPPPPSKYSPHVTASLDSVVLKAMAFDSSERYDDALQLRAALLRADPAAAQLDAPRVAALMRSMLGDELDQRCASWPREVAGELEPTAEITASQLWSLHEFTAADAGTPPGNIDPEPATIPEISKLPSPSPVPSANPSPNAIPAQFHMLVSESAIDTLNLPPVLAAPPEALANARTYRTTELGAVCLVLGVFLGTFLASSPKAPVAPPPLETAAHAPLTDAETTPVVDLGAGPVFTRSVSDAGIEPSGEPETASADMPPPRRSRWSRKDPHAYATRRAAWRAKIANKSAYSSSRSSGSHKPQSRFGRTAP